jgi:phosphohistidine swiveling domain-containing protein
LIDVECQKMMSAPKTLRQHSGPPVEIEDVHFIRPKKPSENVSDEKQKQAKSSKSTRNKLQSAVGKFLSFRWKRSTTNIQNITNKSTKSSPSSITESKHKALFQQPASMVTRVAKAKTGALTAKNIAAEAKPRAPVAKIAVLTPPKTKSRRRPSKTPQGTTKKAEETKQTEIEAVDSTIVVEFHRVAKMKMTLSQVGAKGLRLAELSAILLEVEKKGAVKQTSFRVPPGACLTTSAFDAHLSVPSIKKALENVRIQLEKGIDAGALSSALAELRNIIVSTPLDRTVFDAVASFAQKTISMEKDASSARFAVRSSGSMEDLASKSFAGQYDSILNVSTNVLEKAIKECWASQYKDHVIPYLQDALSPKDGDLSSCDIDLLSRAKMGVVLQLMVKPVASGVMFTLDPSAVEKSERMVVEAVHGLGEGLVSGEITPHSFLLDVRNGTSMTTNKPSQKQKVITKEKDGITMVDTTEKEKSTEPVDPKILSALCNAGKNIAMHYGLPQDIEWCVDESGIVNVVQTRPVTSFVFGRNSGFFHIVGMDPSSPLDESLASAAWADFARECGKRMNSDIIGDQLEDWRFVFGRGYANESLETFLQEDFTSSEVPFDGIENWWKEVDKIYDILQLKESEWTSLTLPIAFKNGEMKSETNSKKKSMTSMKFSQLKNEIKVLMEMYRLASSLSWAMGHVASAWEVQVQRWVEYLGDPEITVEVLTLGMASKSAVSRLKSIANEALILDSNGVTKLLENNSNGDPLTLWSNLTSFTSYERTDGEMFLANSMQKYLKDYYYMAEKDEDLACVHWGEDPSFPLTILFQLLSSKQDVEERKREEEQAAAKSFRQSSALDEYDRVIEHAKECFSKDNPSSISFFKDVERLRTFLNAKEKIHSVYVKMGFHLKRFVLELGDRWCASGELNMPAENLLNATYPMLLGRINNEITATTLNQHIRYVEYQRESWKCYSCPYWAGGHATVIVPDPNAVVLKGDEKRCCTGDVYQGFACSPGKTGEPVEGVVRIIDNLTMQAKLVRSGDILVAHYTSPAWTPLFSLIRGIILEEGGMLSHGAVVARECGIPAVSQIRGATTVLRNGDVVRIHGGSGVVEILKSES